MAPLGYLWIIKGKIMAFNVEIFKKRGIL